MKRIIYIIILLLPLVNGCTKTGSSPDTEKYDRYIFFSQEVETKAALIESTEAVDHFGVVGFKYSNTLTWDGVKSSAIPNVFFDDDGNEVKSETLDCNTDGTAEYDPLQGWSNTMKYAFFAYYPSSHPNVKLVNLDGTDYTGGVPAIKYAMNVSNATGFKTSMVDVMTTDLTHTDKYWNSSTDNNVTNGEVKFTFAHRLSSLGVKVRNSSAAPVTINSLYLIVSDLLYDQIIIPLDGSDITRYEASSAIPSVLSLVLPTNKVSISTGEQKELSEKLIFIPQEEDASVQVSINYTREAAGGYAGYTDSFTTSPLYTQLIDGKKHMIHLNFTDSTIEIESNVSAGAWVDIPGVNNSFN